MSLTRRFLLTVITCIICTFFVSDHVFAAGDETGLTQDIVDILNLILQLLSWLWMPFASIAGGLMTNTMVYGEFFNLGKVLKLIWGISQTFANFVAVAVFMSHIVNGIIQKDLDVKKISTTIMRLIGGVILANASFFLIGALIDVSTIATLAVGSFPSSYMGSMPDLREEVAINVRSARDNKLSLDLSEERESGNMIKREVGKKNTMTEDEIMDTIMPRENSISGPLIYIGGYVLKMSNLSSVEAKTSPSDILLILLTRVGMIVLFTVALIMLIVINLYRIVSIWFLICLAPLIIIMKSGERGDEGEKIAGSILDKFSIMNVIKLIFAPVVSTALIGILLILVVTMDKVIQSNNITINDTVSIHKESNGASTIAGMSMFSTTIEGDLFGDGTIFDKTKNVFSDLLMFAITMGLLWGMIWGISKYSEGGIGGEMIGKMKDLSASLLGSIPLVPMGGGSGVGINSITKRKDDKMSDISRKIEFNKNNATGLEEFENSLRETVGLGITMPKKIRQYFSDFTGRAQDGRFKSETKGLTEYREKLKSTNIQQYYKDRPNTKMADMDEISNSIQAYLQAASSNEEYKKNWGTKGIQLDLRGKDDTVATYITRNYKKGTGNNDVFFKSLYADIGGNDGYIEEHKDRDQGKYFWDERFRRKNAPQEAEATSKKKDE